MTERAPHDALIRSLAGELRPVRPLRSPWLRALLWIATVAAAAIALSCAVGVGGVTRRMGEGMDGSAEVIGAALTSVLAAFAAFLLSVPGRSHRWALLPGPALLLWVAGSGWGCWRVEEVGAQAPGAHPPVSCFTFILAASVPLSVLLFLMLRRAYATSPSLVATLGGLAVAGGAATLLQFVHPFDITTPDLVAHVGAVLAVIGLNRFLSGRALAA